MLRLACVLAAVLSAASSHDVSQGLSCVTDFVNNISCAWNSTTAGPGVDCWIHASIRTMKNSREKNVTGSCKLQQQGVSLSGCSFVFENVEFALFEFSNIRVECDGKTVKKMKYKMQDHIKMNPPEAPTVISTTNETCMSWNLGTPTSSILKTFEFQAQAKCTKQKEAFDMHTSKQQVRLSSERLKGHCQARVRVRPDDRRSFWSDWSPTTSWTSRNEDGPVEKTSLLPSAVTIGSVLLVFLIICTICLSKGRLKHNPLPNPSKYFLPLHSDQGGNLKNWLNPLSVSDTLFTVQPRDFISPVELCNGWDVEPSTSPSSSSTTALLQTRNFPSIASVRSRSGAVVDNFSSSSSSSSCFSNMGYFMSSSSSSAAQTDPSAAYCTHQDEVHKAHRDHMLHLTLCPSSSFSSSATYERLKREPQSPDSGIEFSQENEDDLQEESEDVLSDHLEQHLPFFRLHPAASTCLPPPAVAPPQLPRLPQVCSEELLDNDDDDDGDDDDGDEGDDHDHGCAPIPAASINYAAWPVADATCRPSSVPSDACKPGYLTLKELQTTFRNKSI